MTFEITDTTNPIEFSEHIESICVDGNYIDTIIKFCQENYVDLEDLKTLVHPTLKEKIKADAIRSGLLKSLGSLDF